MRRNKLQKKIFGEQKNGNRKRREQKNEQVDHLREQQQQQHVTEDDQQRRQRTNFDGTSSKETNDHSHTCPHDLVIPSDASSGHVRRIAVGGGRGYLS